MSRKAVPFVILGLTLIAAVALLERGKPFRAQTDNQTSSATTAPTATPHEIDFPYYSLREGFSSTLFLVSDSPKVIALTVTVHGRMGETVATQTSIQPQQKLPVDLRQLLTRLGADVNGAFDEGSVAVSYVAGGPRPVVGQLTITNPVLSLVHESEMTENDPGRSEIPPLLNSLWWGLAAGRDAKFMVSNTGEDAVIADVFLDLAGEQHASAPLTFIAHETKVLSLHELLGDLKFSPAQASEGGITIIQRGSNPALIATGRMTDPSTGFSTTLHFLLPQKQRANALAASGVPLGLHAADSPFGKGGIFVPHVVIRNLLSSPQSATVTVEYPGEQGTEQAVVGPLALGPYTTQDVSLESVVAQLAQPVPYSSIRIQYSGAAGSVVAEVASVEQQENLVVDSHLANEGDGWQGSGANPWHLDEQTESVLFLTNLSDQPARIGFQIQAGGVHYYLTDLKLNPHQTRAIDIRKLRDAQKADFQGNKIPAQASDGTVNWIRLSNVPVAGRLVVINRNTGVASNFDCCPCSCPPSFTSVSVDPASTVTVPGQTQQFTCAEHAQDCNGVDSPSDITLDATWSSSNTAVATVNDSTSKGLVTGVGGGTASIKATFTDVTYPFEPSGICSPTSKALSGSATCDVQALGSFRITVTSTPVPNQSNSFVSKQSGQVKVEALTTTGAVMTLYRGTVHFSSGDPQATLPGNYAYTSSDNGTHTFPITFFTVADTSSTQSVTVQDTQEPATASLHNVNLWFKVTMDLERWKNCDFTACPNLGSYFCQTAYHPSGFAQKTPFIALTYSSSSTLHDRAVLVVNSANGSTQSTTIQDAGPTLTQPYWNNGDVPTCFTSPCPTGSLGGCLSDALMDALGISYGCNPNVGEGLVFWRFQ